VRCPQCPNDKSYSLFLHYALGLAVPSSLIYSVDMIINLSESPGIDVDVTDIILCLGINEGYETSAGGNPDHDERTPRKVVEKRVNRDRDD